MKITCNKNEILKGVNIVLRAIPGKTSMPILECIIINATTSNIKFCSNDMQIGIETTINGIIEEPGNIAINAKIFSEIIRKLPENDVVIETDSHYKMTIVCEKSKFTISGESTAEFPEFPKIEKKNEVILSEFSLREVIRQTIFSVSDNESNKIATGELFEINGKELKIVALDTYRISIRKITLKKEYAPIKVIVPGKTLNEISKILSGEVEDEVHIFFTDKHILFEFENTIMVSRLIEGEYYKINQMLSGAYETKMVINRKNFIDGIERASLLIKEGEKKPIIFDINNEEINLSVNSSIGTLNENVAITKEGKNIMIGFNPKYLIDALRVIDDEDVTVYMTNPKAPCFIKNLEETYNYLILPVNFIGE